MKKRSIKKLASLVSLVVILVVSIGFVSVLAAYDFDITRLFGFLPSPGPDPIVEDPSIVPSFSFQGVDIENSEDLGDFNCFEEYLFTLPYKNFTVKISPDTSDTFDFFVDEGLYNLAAESDLSSGFDLEVDDYSLTLSYVSMFQVLKTLYPDNEIMIQEGQTDKTYSFIIEFTDTVSGSKLISKFSVFVPFLQSISIEDIEF